MSEDPSSLYGEFGQQALVSVEADSAGWQGEDLSVAARAALAALRHQNADIDGLELAVRLSSDDAVHALNRDYRGKDKSTNVLSFPTHNADEVALFLTRLGVDSPEDSLGDLILARGVLEREAEGAGKPLQDHLSHLTVHGVLHLLGHDHMTDETADAMEALETDILASLGIKDPYS